MNSHDKQKRELAIGLLGLGTVASQVYHALVRNQEDLLQKTGFFYQVKKILVRNRSKPRSVSVPENCLTTNFQEILDDPEIKLVVEVMGGLEPAETFIEKAIRSGKSIVTANKAVMGTSGEKLLSLASAQKVDLFFEASVAGAIPILRPLQESLATDRILEITGIVNGTTNFILTQMAQAGVEYGKALKEAQRLGYAEPDPTFDVEGMDAAYKIAILASLAFGFFAKGEQVVREGITKITPPDIHQAKELGYGIKLLATAGCRDDELSLCVAPTLVPFHHPLFNVEGPYNAILVRGERLGDIMFYGQGAGGVPTSTAIVSDIVQAARNMVLGTSGKSLPKKNEKVKLQPVEFMQSRLYLRLEVMDEPGTLAAIAQIFADQQVSFGAVLQKEKTGGITDIIFLTHPAPLGSFQKALKLAEKLPFVRGARKVLRVL